MEYIFERLEMHNSFVNFPEDKEISFGYDRAMREVKPWSFPSFAGSEGVKSSLLDMSLLIRAHLGLTNVLENDFKTLSDDKISQLKTQ